MFVGSENFVNGLLTNVSLDSPRGEVMALFKDLLDFLKSS
jgi:hypothetical protein